MPRRKQVKNSTVRPEDDPLFRALRQVADEALEEDIPERLLRVIRAARDGSRRTDEGGAPGPPPSTTDRNR